VALALALLLATAAARGRFAPPAAPADSSFDSYMRGLSDSTDAWFGAMAAPVDTAGLDSALAAGLALPPGRQLRRVDKRKVPIDFVPAPVQPRGRRATESPPRCRGGSRAGSRVAQCTTGTRT
jgi:hypothetical protein